MATVNLGSIKFNWQGAYNGATAYAVDDVVSYNGSSYICKLASTGNVPTNTTYFDQMSSAGTNGTDLTTTLTTQGDIVYRDGSGLQRLGAGTSGQVLTTGGAGANPSWGSVSSDYVKLAEGTASGSASSISFDNCFDDSIYHSYKIDMYGNVGSGSADFMCMQFLKTSDGSAHTTGNYRYNILDAYVSSSANGTINTFNHWDYIYIKLHSDLVSYYSDNYKPFHYEMTVFKPESTTYRTVFSGFGQSEGGGGVYIRNTYGSGYVNQLIGFRGFKILSGNGENLHSNFTVRLYGQK